MEEWEGPNTLNRTKCGLMLSCQSQIDTFAALFECFFLHNVQSLIQSASIEIERTGACWSDFDFDVLLRLDVIGTMGLN